MTASIDIDPSPYFDHPAGRKVLEWMHELGMDVQVDPQVVADVAVDREAKTVFLPPGHRWDEAHRLIGRGSLYIAGGHKWAPEFMEHAAPVPPGRVVTPLVRRPW